MKNFLLTVAMILSTISIFAQVPQAINYQAVVRNTAGDVIKNQNVRFKLSITEGVTGTTTYAETHQATTTNLGLVNLTIGSGTVATGTFSAVNWASGNKFLKIEIDATGGTTYALMGTQQLVSVPYSMYAATSGAVANQWQFNPGVGQKSFERITYKNYLCVSQKKDKNHGIRNNRAIKKVI